MTAPSANPTAVAPVTVVLVHWNQPERCADTIEAFQDQGVPVSIVVVDNGSVPTAFARLREIVDTSPHDVTLVPLGANTGFGPGANTGWRVFLTERSGEWSAVAPHDALPQPGTLARMIEAATEVETERGTKVGLVSADVGDGMTPVVDPYFGGMIVAGRVESGWEDCDYPHGTLMLARRACLDEVGLFDERYFAYCEEADLGVRAKAAGWSIGLVRGARVVNPTMRSGSPVTDYLMHRNTLLLVRDHSGRYKVFIRFCIALIHMVRGLIQPSSRNWMFSAKGRVWGMIDFLRGRFGPPPAFLFDAEPQIDDGTHTVGAST